MDLNEAKKILNEHGYFVESTNKTGRLIFGLIRGRSKKNNYLKNTISSRKTCQSRKPCKLFSEYDNEKKSNDKNLWLCFKHNHFL